MKKTFIIISIFIALISSRLFFIEKKEDITLYITLINSISFIIVIISDIEDTYQSLKLEINNRKIAKQLKDRYIKNIKFKEIVLCCFSLLVFIGLFFSSDKFNDAFSIFTVGISLLSKEITDIFIKILKRWCRL